MYGTVQLLPVEDRRRIKGFIINKFRGDEKLLESGVTQLEKLTGIPVLGIIPYVNVRLPSEDSVSLGDVLPSSNSVLDLSLIHISEPTRRTPISYAVFCLKKKKPHVPGLHKQIKTKR